MSKNCPSPLEPMASKRRQRAKACGNKVRYSQSTAQIEAYKRRAKIGEFITHYACPFCNGYHIGHRKGGVRGQKPKQNRRRGV